MDATMNPYDAPRFAIAAEASTSERAGFITKTYLHLAGAIGLLVLLEFVLLRMPFTEPLIARMIGGQYSWLIVLGLFMFVSWIAESWASSSTSTSTQYMGLGLYVVAEAVILLPMVYIANSYDAYMVPTAAVATLGLTGVLTVIVFLTRKDFSFLRVGLMYGGFAALGLIAASAIFQFSLGQVFTYAMIAFACGYILYHTSNVLHHYRIGQHVAASLSLFASVALLFWYILRLFMSRD